MKRLRLYLDTSVISYLTATDAPEKMDDTLELWNLMQFNEYDIIISELTFNELLKCTPEKRNQLANYVAKIDYIHVPLTEESENLAQEYLKHKVLTDKSFDDLSHIACSVLNDCDYILSWNFKHFVNIKTINRVNSVNLLLGYEVVKIIPPSMFIGGNDDEE